ncbi:GntR family transcriptional regulator [Catenuloplanes indicus]|uniref:DNA-binding transcriptional regulator YhcF (GntR family) n=1 Tax=Catenuloplanes indicus TaxID=137267 RepID=A0AAE3VWE9_9ACTN|nr:GntR family transcriptional regulator [Catenuloplanes indicus]MDQ0364842.1 DNA-binding transcriptional regulator YhcF (GntR family) [Catenuloplanes indicus]
MSVSRQSDVPVYRQIVSQVTLMIEMGLLGDGDRLPGSRLLASNLGINRNTVAHAYGELRELGLIEPRGRNGMVVVGGGRARTTSETRNRAREILSAAARECLGLGLTAAEIRDLIAGLAAWEADKTLAVSFVECNDERARYFATELGRQLGVAVKPLVLGAFDAAGERPDLVLTTFFHLSEARTLLRRPETEVVAIVAAPHIQTLVQIAQVPKDRTVGLLYSTEDQAVSIRDSLTQAGVSNIEVLTGTTDEDLRDVDLVVVPSESPELARRLEGRVRVIEFGNVLDAASVRMAGEVMRELQLAKTTMRRP